MRAFGLTAQDLYFLATSMVFGSNTSASSWEPFRRVIKFLIPIHSKRTELVEKHKSLLDMLVWEGNYAPVCKLGQASKCSLNPGALDQHGPLEAYIHVDNILASRVGKKNMLRLLATIIEAIFTVSGCLMIEVCQCPLYIEKWNELVIGTVQTIFGLTPDTNMKTVGITSEYHQQVLDLLSKSLSDIRHIFKVRDIQKYVGKVACLCKGTPWIY